MTKNFDVHALIGNALGFPGAWGPGWAGWGPGAGMVAFGEQSPQAAAQRGCMPFVPGTFDPNLMNALIAKQHSVIVGADYGPQETEQMIGCEDDLEIEPGESATINFTPELVCKLVRLFIPTKIASSLVVQDLTIGIKSQFPGKGSISGLIFSEVSTNNRINGDTCYIRQPIVARVKNVSDVTVTFEGAVGVVAVQGAGPRIIGPGSGHQ